MLLAVSRALQLGALVPGSSAAAALRLGLKAAGAVRAAAPASLHGTAPPPPPRAGGALPVPPSAANPGGILGWVFDIDGVLIRGATVLPAARKAMQMLWSGGAWRAPVVFLTNGGGVSEARKAQELTGWLGVPVAEGQVVLSHTPFRRLAPRLGQHPVLVCGRKDFVAVAASYGFSKVLTTKDLSEALGGAATPFGGAPRETAPPGSRPVAVYFSNPDLLWANDHARPRFGQGAFATALDALHRATTGGPIPEARFFGKPNPEPYELAEQLLVEQAVGLGLAPPSAAEDPASAARALFSAIYAVGDNPAADVRGANSRGPPWVSVLVRTGVFEGREANSAADPAHAVVDDAAAAVEAARHRARAAVWHSMR
ncbi:MAG: HAD-superfamily hydrolase [Monoraphidium minutum]|nr:MAG: HAD-superfamily hydrolase [Monoraphidium minutum]